MANKLGQSMVGGQGAVPPNGGIPNKAVSGSKVGKGTPRGKTKSMKLANGATTGIMRNPS